MTEILEYLLSSRAAEGRTKLWEFKYRKPVAENYFCFLKLKSSLSAVACPSRRKIKHVTRIFSVTCYSYHFLGLQERKETIRGVYSVIDQLSRTHLNTLERLIFHLVR